MADSGAAGLALLATKLFVPRPRPDLVARPRLLTRLHTGLDRGPCTLLSAPAGAGKTSLLAAWAAELDRPVGWLALDERDQDVHTFLRYLLAAAAAIRPGPAGWSDGPPPPPEAVLTDLINDLAAAGPAGVLVLDDYHVVHAPPVHDAVGFLLDHLPPNLHLVIASREDPPLQLPRLRARGQLVELRADDLGFRVEEAAALLGDGMRLRLTDAQVQALVERTEGWAAGLQLAGLALRDRPDPGAFVSAFTGDHRLVSDYLSAEVLHRQPPRVRRFLAVTAGLDRLCAPLCDALLADGEWAGGDARTLLAELERANLFLVALDDQRIWYRYHHLFADTLRAQLARELDAEATAALHRRAGEWFGRAGLLPEAIRHALAAGAFDDAADHLETLTPVMFASVDVHRTMADWLAALPDATVRARPMLCLAHAWLQIHHLQVPGAAAWTDAATRALALDSGAAGRHSRGAVAAMRALLATLGPGADPDAACALAEQALADLPAADVPFRGVAAVAYGQAELARGRPERAERVLGESAAEGRSAGRVHGALVVAGYQVSVQRLRGARRRAMATGQEALAWAEERGSVGAGLGVLAVLVADLLADGNELAAARPLMEAGHRVLARVRERPPLVLLASLGLARLRLYAGEPEAAAELLAQVRPLLAHGPFAGLARILAAGEAQVRLALGDAPAAVDWAGAEPGTIPAMFRLQTHVFSAGVGTLLLVPAQILVAHGRATGDDTLLRRAVAPLDAAAEQAERGGLGWLGLRVTILRAVVADGLGDRSAAEASLDAAVAAAEPEGVLRPFVDAGPPVRALLTARRRAATDVHRAAFLDRLVGAFPAGPAGPAGPAAPAGPAGPAPCPGLVEPLTARELDVLRLLAAGRSNAGMAHLLTVEQSTVKTHLVHLYEKLGVHSRTQAVARARALHLLD